MVKTLKNNSRAFGIFLFVFSTLISVFAFIFREQFKDGQTLGLLGILIINFFSSATFFVSGPAFLTVIAGGSIYPPILVGLIAAFGTALGDVISFFFGYSTRHLALAKLEKRLLFRVFEDFFKIHGNWILFLMALIPNPFFDAAGLVAGIFKFNIKRYFIIVFVGRFVRFLLLAYIGEWHFN